MRRYLWLLLCGLFLAPPGLAAKPAERPGEPDARQQVLSGELNQFVREAINEGLLDAAGSGAAAREAVSEEVIGPGSEGIASVPPETEAALTFDCSQPYPLDFSEFTSVSTYSDILNYRTQVLQAGVGANDASRLARAYVALDLGSEAVMNLRTPDSSGDQILRRVALLLDGRMRTNVADFQALAGCYDRGAFWLGVALLADGRGEGAAHIENTFGEFRHLPLQLRTSVTAITVPALDATGGRFLAQKMLTSFSAAEIQDSAQLQFSKAIYDLGQGSPEAEKLIRTYLLQGRFQEEALFALIRHNRTIDADVRSILLDGMLVKIEQSQRDEDIRAGLKFVLDELSAESRYTTMLEMAGRANMQTETAQAEIRSRFVESLQRDLASDDPLHNLAAIEALSAETGLLDHHANRTALYEAATLKAVRLGFASLAEELSRKAQPGDTVAEKRAMLAYRMKDYPAVFQFALDNPSNQQIGLVAALSAIESNDAVRLQAQISGLKLDDKVILALIEHDAVEGRWIVPDGVYQTAAGFVDETSKARAGRVLTLRAAARTPPGEPVPARISAVPERLMSTRMALETFEGEGD